MPDEKSRAVTSRPIRWRPAGIVLLLTVAALVWVFTRKSLTFQDRNLSVLTVALVAFLLLVVWWMALSRAPGKWRLWAAGLLVAAIGLGTSLFRIRGFSGDVLPILEPRWRQPTEQRTPQGGQQTASLGPDFPQFLGPNRTGMLEGPVLDPDWAANPPRVLWRKPIGAAWSGWALVGARAFTQEQRAREECVTCYDALAGEVVWRHTDPAHYKNALAGEGPRCTPTVVSNRVFTLGATGVLNCLDAATGTVVWRRSIVEEAGSKVPEWGFAGSPLVEGGRVVVSAGGADERSLLAFEADSGRLAWSAGTRKASYSSPVIATLAKRPQFLAFNARMITAHDAASGEVLWEYPWGNGEPQVSVPVVVSANRVLFSSAYGVGSELLEVNESANRRLAASQVWKSKKLKSKFGSIVLQGGFAYGLDDGVLVCLDLKDGSQRWKGGRYGHGQGLLVRDLLVLMAENGELVLFRPNPDGPRELHRFKVFQGKTWNPIAISGELLLARTEREAVGIRLKSNPNAETRNRGEKSKSVSSNHAHQRDRRRVAG